MNFLKSIIEFLKKIGVIKVGTTNWKGDASKRPIDDDDIPGSE